MALVIFDEVQATIKKDKELEAEFEEDESETEGLAPEDSRHYRIRLMETLIGLPASGFERLCQRLLRESGFQEVKVTGRSGDGGINGNGILQINPFVSFQVLFQCKRYSSSQPHVCSTYRRNACRSTSYTKPASSAVAGRV